jgi:hypothetical protein
MIRHVLDFCGFLNGMNMRKISHRGNLAGPSDKENVPVHIESVIRQGYDCEIDVHFTGRGSWYLGHDGPEYSISLAWLYSMAPYLWIHAKTPGTFHELHRHRNVLNYFWHDTDVLAMTSLGYSWTCNASALSHNTVYMCADTSWQELEITPFKLCTDYIL